MCRRRLACAKEGPRLDCRQVQPRGSGQHKVKQCVIPTATCTNNKLRKTVMQASSPLHGQGLHRPGSAWESTTSVPWRARSPGPAARPRCSSPARSWRRAAACPPAPAARARAECGPAPRRPGGASGRMRRARPPDSPRLRGQRLRQAGRPDSRAALPRAPSENRLPRTAGACWPATYCRRRRAPGRPSWQGQKERRDHHKPNLPHGARTQACGAGPGRRARRAAAHVRQVVLRGQGRQLRVGQRERGRHLLAHQRGAARLQRGRPLAAQPRAHHALALARARAPQSRAWCFAGASRASEREAGVGYRARRQGATRDTAGRHT